MEIVDQLVIPRRAGPAPAALLQLLGGDLAAIPASHAVDALVVSAFPGSYEPYNRTLFKALFERGLDMRDVARHKREDLRDQLGCWISEPLPPAVAERFNFERILCFEPRHPEFIRSTGMDLSNIEASVGYVFRCLNNFVLSGRQDGRKVSLARVALPLLATGNQGVPVELMLPRLLDAAVFWLEQGLPVHELKIVAFGDDSVAAARGIFRRLKERVSSQAFAHALGTQVVEACASWMYGRLLEAAHAEERAVLERVHARLGALAPGAGPNASAPPGSPGEDDGEYDVFVSYAHKQDAEVSVLVDALTRRLHRSRVFYDRTSIPPGGQWLKTISDAIARSRCFVAVLSPDYSVSPVCWDEFQCAKLKEYTSRHSVIRTVRLYSETSMPPIMGTYSYIDCVEGNLENLRRAAAELLPA